MDPDIREALADIKSDVRDGFKAVNERIDRLVTKGEFEATIQRIDAQHATLRRDFDSHETRTEAHYTQTRTDDEAVKRELKGELEGFRATARWALGLAAPVVAVIAAIVFGVLNAIK